MRPNQRRATAFTTSIEAEAGPENSLFHASPADGVLGTGNFCEMPGVGAFSALRLSMLHFPARPNFSANPAPSHPVCLCVHLGSDIVEAEFVADQGNRS